MTSEREITSNVWCFVSLYDCQPIIPEHNTNVGNWLYEIALEEHKEPRFWRMK